MTSFSFPVIIKLLTRPFWAEISGKIQMEAYQLTRSKRKSLSIVIGKDGKIRVKAPNWLPKYQIDQFIQQKAGWIEEKRSEISMREQERPAHTFQEGDTFLLFGKPYRLAFCSWAKDGQGTKEGHGTGWEQKGAVGAQGITLDQKEKALIMGLNTGHAEAASVQKALEKWYISQARQVFPERASQYYPLVSRLAGGMGKEISPVNRIAVRNQKTRWGSCSSKGNLNFNWRLLMAPSEVLDYVVVHELCHLAYLDHSKQFWQMVAAVLPDWKERRNWLKANGMYLDWEWEPQ